MKVKLLVAFCILVVVEVNAQPVVNSGAQIITKATQAAGVVSGTTTVTGGSNTQVCFNDTATLSCGDSGFTYNKTTDSATLTGTLTAGTGTFTTLTAPFDLGNADTTITRAGAGLLAVEGNTVATLPIANIFTTTQTISASVADETTIALLVKNTNGGSAAGTRVRVLNDQSDEFSLINYGAGYSSSGPYVARAGLLLHGGAGAGLNIVDAAGPVSLWTRSGSDTKRLEIGANGSLNIERTITPGGTTGAQTINKMAGTVNFAAAATSVVITNSIVTTSSIIFATIRTADATCVGIKSVVPGSGTFTITVSAACTAETSIGFWVTN